MAAGHSALLTLKSGQLGPSIYTKQRDAAQMNHKDQNAAKNSAFGPSLILHVGPPRTATTTLQKSVFPALKAHLCLQKLPYTSHSSVPRRFSSWSTTKSNTGYLIDPKAVEERLGGLNNHVSLAEDAKALHELFSIVKSLAHIISHNDHWENQQLRTLLRTALGVGASCAKSIGANVLVASESLSNSTFPMSLKESLFHRIQKLEVDAVCREWRLLTHGNIPVISFCLREPIDHLYSRYTRYMINCQANKRKALTPRSWTHAQCKALLVNRQHSALFPALHQSFSSYHSELGYIKVYTYQQLMDSHDVCSLLGLANEAKVGFASLPRENRSPMNARIRYDMIQEITSTLRAEGCFDMVMDERLFRDKK